MRPGAPKGLRQRRSPPFEDARVVLEQDPHFSTIQGKKKKKIPFTVIDFPANISDP